MWCIGSLSQNLAFNNIYSLDSTEKSAFTDGRTAAYDSSPAVQ